MFHEISLTGYLRTSTILRNPDYGPIMLAVLKPVEVLLHIGAVVASIIMNEVMFHVTRSMRPANMLHAPVVH